MKYIRLKDGKIVDQYQTVRPQYVVKRADTIEELCDCFVLTDSRNSFYQVEEDKNAVSGKDIICYGAIWTEKGLIFVAKMNEKGELELL